MSTISPDLPLIDLHRHLEGNVRPKTVFDLRRQHGLPLPVDDPGEFRKYVQVDSPQPGLLAFFEKFDWVTGALVDYEACDRIAYESVVDARREGLDYFEDKLSSDRCAIYHLLCLHDRRRMVWAGSTVKPVLR